MTAELILVAVFGGAHLGVKPPEPPKPAAPVIPEFELRFADESTVRANLLDPSIKVRTKYGELTIPVHEVRKVELGMRFPEGMEKKIAGMVIDLAAKEFAVREAAEKGLAAAGEWALPAIRQAAKSSDPEVVRRADSVLKAIKEKLPGDRGEPKNYDTIETAEFTFQGIVETPSLRVKTKYFAETPIKLTELRGVRSTGAESNESIALDVAQYGRPNDQTWMQTKIDVTAGQPLTIAATGQIDLWPQQGGQYMVGPNGQPQHGTGTPIIGSSGRAYQYTSGTVIGRIGTSGEPFAIGAGSTTRPNVSGKLYLKMASPPWGNAPNGSYKVTVKTGQ